MGLIVADGESTAVIAPAGEVVKVNTWPPDDDKMIGVIWNSTNLKMFAQDILERGEETEPVSGLS